MENMGTLSQTQRTIVNIPAAAAVARRYVTETMLLSNYNLETKQWKKQYAFVLEL